MAGDWIECTLADACSAVDYGLTASATADESGPKFLRITDIVTGYVDWKSVPNVAADAQTVVRFELKEDDIVLARTGASTGASAYIKAPPRAVFASYLVRLQAKPEFDARFLSYYLKSDAFWNFIRGVLGDKSAQPNASASTMTKAPLRAPRDKEKQRAIAHVLGTLDDKIEANRRLSQTLESMVRALFKSWFVDFDPVRAKVEGRDTGLPESLATLFPARFVDSELDQIPEGWQVRPVADVADVTGGSTPSTSVQEYWEGGVYHWATPKDLSDLSVPVLLKTERKITDAGLRQISSGLLPPGTVLLSSRAPIGYLAISEIPVAVNQGFIAIKPTGRLSNLFLLRWADAANDEILSRSNGSTFLEINKANFRTIPLVVPSDECLAAFDRCVLPLHSRVVANERESHTLSALRDTLLPKLMSGEVRVDAAERLVSDASA